MESRSRNEKADAGKPGSGGLEAVPVGRVVALCLLLLFPAGASAQPYPVKPVRVIVAQAPGNVSDLLIRFLGQKLSEILGQPLIVDNRPGAGTNIGAEVAARTPPDGYSLFVVSAPHAIAPSLYRNLAYDIVRDFAPVSLLGSEPLALVVHPSLPARSVRELVTFLKARPGEVSYGSSGNGTVNHLATALFESRAGVKMVHVPYKGSVYAIPDALQGVIPVLIANVSVLEPHVRSGRLRALAVTSSRRVRTVPDVPTIAESAYPGYEAVNWFGIAAPARTSGDIIMKLNTAIGQAMSLADVRQFYENRGADQRTSTPEEMQLFLRSEITKWAAAVKSSGARID